MTRGLVASLPTGRFLVANSFDTVVGPRFAVTVPPPAARADLWRSLKEYGVARRMAFVFENGAAFWRWYRFVGVNIPANVRPEDHPGRQSSELCNASHEEDVPMI